MTVNLPQIYKFCPSFSLPYVLKLTASQSKAFVLLVNHQGEGRVETNVNCEQTINQRLAENAHFYA